MTGAWQGDGSAIETEDMLADMTIIRCLDMAPHDLRRAGPRARIAIATLSGQDTSRASARRRCRDLLARLLPGIGIPAGSHWQLGRCESGAPFLVVDGNRSHYGISLSHCRQAIAVGVSYSAALGVDVESIRSLPRMAGISCFLGWPVTTEEPCNFWMRWTLAEAFAKHNGGSILACAGQASASLATRHEPGKLFGNSNATALCERISSSLVLSVVIGCSPCMGLTVTDASPDLAGAW